jgi:hypothetical protein
MINEAFIDQENANFNTLCFAAVPFWQFVMCALPQLV